jgi:hypothetical protein
MTLFPANPWPRLTRAVGLHDGAVANARAAIERDRVAAAQRAEAAAAMERYRVDVRDAPAAVSAHRAS